MLKPMRIAAILVLGLASAAHTIVMVEETEIDLGYTYRDEPQKMVFELRNAASDTLRTFPRRGPSTTTTGRYNCPGRGSAHP